MDFVKNLHVRWLRCCHLKTMNLRILVWTMVFQFFSIIFAKRERDASSSFRVVLGDFGCDVTCQACRENLLRTHTRFQASSGNSDSMDWPGYEAGDASQNGGS